VKHASLSSYKRAIHELETEIERNAGAISSRLRKLGEYLSYQDSAAIPTSEMKELHGRLQELRRQLPESRQQVKRILQTVAGSQELERQIRERKRRISELSEKNQEIFESIGRAAFKAYRRLGSQEERYRKLFDPLEGKERELSEVEKEYEAVQQHGREGKFFRIFRETGRSVYLKGLISLRRRAIGKAYYEAGKRFCGSPLREEMKGGGLQKALAPYEDNARQIGALSRELEKLAEEQEKKWSELKSLGAHRSHQKRVREIESEIRRIEEQLEDGFEALGTLFRGARPAQIEDAEAAGIASKIREIEQESKNKSKQIERLKAAMQIEALQGQLGSLSDRISKLEEEIEFRREEIQTLRTQIAEGESEIQRLQRVRGSRQQLMKDIDDAESGEEQ
jgi:predicted  nucleic acid-binding Zn-ribbon protein